MYVNMISQISFWALEESQQEEEILEKRKEMNVAGDG